MSAFHRPEPKQKPEEPPAPVMATEPEGLAPAISTRCELCGADPRMAVKGFDCMCMKRQTVEGKLASARYKEAAARAVAEKAKK